MPSSYPFPSIAALALSLYASARMVERLPTIREYIGQVQIVACPASLASMLAIRSTVEGI